MYERQQHGCCRPTACAIYIMMASIILAAGHDCHFSETCSCKSNTEAGGEGQAVSMLQRNFAPQKSSSKEKSKMSVPQAKNAKLLKSSAEKKSPDKKSPEATEKKFAEKSTTVEKAKSAPEKSTLVKKAPENKLAEKSTTVEKAKKSPEKVALVKKALEKKLARKSTIVEKAKKSPDKSIADKASVKSRARVASDALTEVATTVETKKSRVRSGQKEHKSTANTEEKQVPEEEAEPSSTAQQMFFASSIMLPIAFLLCGNPIGGTPGEDAHHDSIKGAETRR